MSDDRAAALWDRHFRDPEGAFAEAQALLRDADDLASGVRAWCELTIAYHHLFFTANPREARPWIAAAAERFAALDEAVDFCLTKGRQIVDEQGDRLFG